MEALKTLVALVIGFFVGSGALLGGFAYSALAYGYVLKTLWRWFVVSTFHVTALPLVVAAGLILIVSLVVHTVAGVYAYQAINAADEKNKWTRAIDTVARPWITLLFGWILTLFL